MLGAVPVNLAEIAHVARLLCPGQGDHPARVAGSLVTAIERILDVGHLGQRVLVPLPGDHRAAVIWERFP